MSVASVISQLRGLLDKANLLIPKLAKIYPNEQQWDALGDISEELAMAAKTIKKDIRESRVSRADRAWKDSEVLRSRALECKGELLTNGRLKLSPVFRRNIVTIFEGPKNSKFDSEETKIRKATTLQRCEQIRQLSPSGVISWAISFAPSVWAGGSMATDIFTCLLDEIEPDWRPSWPPIVRQTLHILLEDEDILQKSREYQDFLTSYDNSENDEPGRRRKRRRLDNIEQETQSNQGSPSNGSREMQHMYTNSDPACIEKLPESFRTAIRQSRLWKWERSKAMKTTGCLSTLFPMDNTQDVSLTIWCGNVEAYNINDEFELELAASYQHLK
ncbi:hypothetical protein N7474_010152 [Penicillium riverlandense]|uniref:uncharacterized protein n=1 Tax=Penicillium riverlandense TaxID=1903569 RepID=UPI002549157F|nr:uncharacterized protein N7474_010152 [Penicillium riverlandense]KAJ5808883.1 hypothetical protein N7474_010152 [Penicillium riverlandense]